MVVKIRTLVLFLLIKKDVLAKILMKKSFFLQFLSRLLVFIYGRGPKTSSNNCLEVAHIYYFAYIFYFNNKYEKIHIENRKCMQK